MDSPNGVKSAYIECTNIGILWNCNGFEAKYEQREEEKKNTKIVEKKNNQQKPGNMRMIQRAQQNLKATKKTTGK